jgi:hypothetical protein
VDQLHFYYSVWNYVNEKKRKDTQLWNNLHSQDPRNIYSHLCAYTMDLKMVVFRFLQVIRDTANSNSLPSSEMRVTVNWSNFGSWTPKTGVSSKTGPATPCGYFFFFLGSPPPITPLTELNKGFPVWNSYSRTLPFIPVLLLESKSAYVWTCNVACGHQQTFILTSRVYGCNFIEEFATRRAFFPQVKQSNYRKGKFKTFF